MLLKSIWESDSSLCMDYIQCDAQARTSTKRRTAKTATALQLKFTIAI